MSEATTRNRAAPLLEVRDLTRRFGGLTALDGVSLRVEAGSAMALLGENGAGKSTLTKVCCGMLQPDAGTLRWEGRTVTLADPAAARRLGIGTVQQHFTLVPAMTVAENLALATPGGWRLSPRSVEAAARDLMVRTGIRIEPSALVSDLPVGMQQRVEILRALSAPTRLLILDEPTAVLAPTEVTELFDVLRRLLRAGTAVVLITHKLPEALALADRVAVLRRGRKVLDEERARVTAESLALAMVGRPMETVVTGQAVREGCVVLATPLLAPPGGEEGVVREGETVGVAGVEGNGQSELVETVVGLRPGPVRLRADGGLVNAGRWSVAQRLKWGLACIPADRHAVALALSAPVCDNLFFSGDMMPRRGPWLDRPAARRIAAALTEEYDVRTPSLDTPVLDLSGGNQQKVVVAREMSRHPRLLVAMHPTRGLDVAASNFVHSTLRAHKARGGAALLVSSELEELLALSDRIVVMYGGRVIGELTPTGSPADTDTLARMMTGAA